MAWIAHDDMVKNFDFDKLASADEVAGHFNVGFRWLWLACYAANGISGVIPHAVLCRMAHDLPGVS